MRPDRETEAGTGQRTSKLNDDDDMSATTTTTRRRRVDPTLGEAKSLLSLALLSPVEIKGLGYRELWFAERAGQPVSESVQNYIRTLPLDRMAGIYIRWRREDGAKARRLRLKDMAVSFLVRESFSKTARDREIIKAAKRELIGFALVKLGLGHLSYAKPWLPKRRKLNAGGAQ